MKVVATIAEYNPLHTGHIYHINETKKALNPDLFVVVMSGNFTERGDIALVEKHIRAKWAILAGADIVLELPFNYAVNCAEQFAIGATKVLSTFNTPLTISFGSECGNIDKLLAIANATTCENEDFKKDIKESLKTGMSYPKAYAKSLNSEIDLSPNNILGIEYIKASKKYNFDTFTIQRNGDYNSTELGEQYASATAIRNYIFSDKKHDIINYLPDFVYNSLDNCIDNNTLSDMILYKISTLSADYIKSICDVNEGLENRIKLSIRNAKNYDEIVDYIKSKRYTMAKIKRIILNILLDNTTSNRNYLYSATPYARVLAINSYKQDALSMLSNSGHLIVNIRDVASQPDDIKESIEFENKVDSIYSVASKQTNNFNAVFVNK